MKDELILAWLKQQQFKLDLIIAEAGREFYEHHKSCSNFVYDLAACQSESFNLIHDKDLCYDRPNTAFCYSLWYHARRVNTFLSHFARTILKNERPTMEFFDLGAGTGAVQWAVGLIYHKMKEEGYAVPKIRIVNIDTSPIMLQYSRNYLWKHFLLKYPICNDFNNDIEYEVNAWNNNRKIAISNPWITASYLFDISDTTGLGDYRKAVLTGFTDIIELYNPAKLLLLTAVSKEALMDDVTSQFNTNDFIIEKIKHASLLLSSNLTAVNSFRHELLQKYDLELNTREERSIGNPAVWDDHSFVATVITRKTLELFNEERSLEGIKLHDASIKVRREVVLNPEQKKAAKNVNHPTVIIGPAGCGKSIVITERIKNIVEEFDYNPEISILVTTFNKELLGQLTNWICDVLDPNRYTLEFDRSFHGVAEKPCKFYFVGSKIENIRLLHFDMLPRVIGRVPAWGLVNDNVHKAILNSIIKAVKDENRVVDSQFENILNPDFLLEEYHRVIYGLKVGINDGKENYLTISRQGRGGEPQLKRKSERRLLVWECLERYAKHIYSNRIPSFTLRRQLFLTKLANGEISTQYDYVLIDEFQDCTKADFEIFFHLLKHPNYLLIAGDLAQAVHLGKSANIDTLREAIREGRTMNDIKWNYLDGSYRLPFRICEAVKRISEYINLSFKKNKAASILTPYKGAPPGTRPIIVYGKNEKDISIKITDILERYKDFGLIEKCILEKDDELQRELQIPTDTVLRLKGLEKHCVIWSTRTPLEFKKEKFEFVYTILSRTSCILIIALFNDPDNEQSNTQDIFMEAIGLLRRDRIIFWDKETEEAFDLFCQDVQNGDLENDEEDN